MKIRRHAVEAIQYDGSNDKEVIKFIQDKLTKSSHNRQIDMLVITITEFDTPIEKGTWIVYENARIRVYDDAYVRETYELVE